MSTQVLGATALALLVGVSTFAIDTATAQNGSEARSNDRALQKQLDDRELTPIRPIRRVGPDSWPAAKDPRPTNLPLETSGQAAKDSSASDSAKQETARQPPTQHDQQTQSTAQQRSTPKEDAAKQTGQQPAPNQDTAKQDNGKQNAAKPQQAAQGKSDSKQQAAQDRRDAKPNTKPDTRQEAKQDAGQADKSFASIRLGTDAKGRVAINDAQERQISKALRKHPVKTSDVDVTIGATAPAEVELGAVSADLVAVLPQFRGYSFFATRDEIVIVEPDDRKIVALVPVRLTTTASKPREERTTRSEARSRKTVDKKEFTVGRRVPTEEEILSGPVVTVPGNTTVTRTYRTYRAEPSETVIIERRRPRLFGLW